MTDKLKALIEMSRFVRMTPCEVRRSSAEALPTETQKLKMIGLLVRW